MTHKLKSKIIIKGKVIAETGLMIGGSSSALEIGGTDKQIIRNPVDKSPYIPGSSLKGKMRSLLEISRGTVTNDERGKDVGNPTQNPADEAAQLFGHINRNTERIQQPSRLIVRDGVLTKDSRTKLKDTELLYTEVKAENSINRITAEANPRFFERVPKNAEFELNMTLNVFDDIKGSEQLNLVFECLRLIQDDYLGGGGSRGNGQVIFKLESVKRRSTDTYYKQGGSAEEVLDIPKDLQ
jgi:CRISPR-associated protein Csm3